MTLHIEQIEALEAKHQARIQEITEWLALGTPNETQEYNLRAERSRLQRALDECKRLRDGEVLGR